MRLARREAELKDAVREQCRRQPKNKGKTPAYCLVMNKESVKTERAADISQEPQARQREGDGAQHTQHTAPTGHRAISNDDAICYGGPMDAKI